MRVLVRALTACALAAASTLFAQSPGTLLVAARGSHDAEFAQAVVLVVHTGPEGAMGLVMNRRTKVPLASVFPELAGSKGGAAPVYNGGPMRMGINGVLRSRAKPQAGSRILPGVYVLSAEADVKKLAAAASPDIFRVYVGLCGWSPGQLDGELRRGIWKLAPADPSALFDRDPDSLWTRLTNRRGK